VNVHGSGCKQNYANDLLVVSKIADSKVRRTLLEVIALSIAQVTVYACIQ
jgi:hypothetical protein